MLALYIVSIACSIALCGSSDCESWFKDDPSRCDSEMYLKWCPYSSQSVCGRSNSATSDEAQRPRPGPKSVKKPYVQKQGSQETDRDCADWFRKKPERCNGIHRKWCPSGAAEVCPGQKGNPQRISEESRDVSMQKSVSRSVDSGKSESYEEPSKSVESIEQKSVEKVESRQTTSSDLNKIFNDCAKDHGTPGECRDYASYSNFDLKRMVCKNIDCVNHLGPIMYCASNGKNNFDSCCEPLGIKSICRPFCDGTAKLNINIMFSDASSALKYRPCLERQDDIIRCHEKNHSGKPDTTVKRYNEKVGDSMKSLLQSQCSNR